MNMARVVLPKGISLYWFRRREHGAGSPQAKRKAGWSPRAATPKDDYQTETTAAAAATVKPWPVASKSAAAAKADPHPSAAKDEADGYETNRRHLLAVAVGWR